MHRSIQRYQSEVRPDGKRAGKPGAAYHACLPIRFRSRFAYSGQEEVYRMSVQFLSAPFPGCCRSRCACRGGRSPPREPRPAPPAAPSLPPCPPATATPPPASPEGFPLRPTGVRPEGNASGMRNDRNRTRGGVTSGAGVRNDRKRYSKANRNHPSVRQRSAEPQVLGMRLSLSWSRMNLCQMRSAAAWEHYSPSAASAADTNCYVRRRHVLAAADRPRSGRIQALLLGNPAWITTPTPLGRQRTANDTRGDVVHTMLWAKRCTLQKNPRRDVYVSRSNKVLLQYFAMRQSSPFCTGSVTQRKLPLQQGRRGWFVDTPEVP